MEHVADFVHSVVHAVPGYRRFLDAHAVSVDAPFEALPLQTKQNYLLAQPIEDLCWHGEIGNCHLIGSSSGFSKSGSVYWPKRPADELSYLESIEHMLCQNYRIDTERTLIFCCMALGTWFGGMTITAALRVIAASGRLPITVCTPGLNLAEAVEVYARFHTHYKQVLWITNPSNIGLISALLSKRNISIPPGTCRFPVIGEYFSEAFRESVALRYGHPADAPFVVWTGYGSADTGDIGVETTSTIRLRKYLHAHQALGTSLLGEDDTPMILALSPKAHVEILQGKVVVTKDQLVPLVRYNTGDEGGFLWRSELERLGSIPAEVLNDLPEQMLFVRGRATDTIIFYGTNLNVQSINQHFLSLPKDMLYSGMFTVRKVDENEFTVFDFNVFVEKIEGNACTDHYKNALIGYLKGQSHEFATKYSELTRAMGQDLIQLRVTELNQATGAIKHRFIID